MSSIGVETAGNVLTVERVFSTSRQNLWDAWTNKELFEKWWGPNGWSTKVKYLDFSEGGYMHYGMKCEDEKQGEWFGQVSWGKFAYGKIDTLNSIQYTDYFVDENCMVDDKTPSTPVDMRFEEVEGGTKLISISTMASEEALKQLIEMQMIEGLSQTWERLGELVEDQL